MHPSAPSVVELENVPNGQGNNVATFGLLSDIFLSPEAKRAEISSAFLKNPGLVTRIASVAILMGFLGKK